MSKEKVKTPHKLSSLVPEKMGEVEVRFDDQQKINEFGRLNNRLLEIRAETSQGKQDMSKLEDAISELEMVLDGKALLFIGAAFVEVGEDYANEYLEKKKKVSTF